MRLIGAQAYLLVDGDEITLVDAGHAGSARMLRPYLARIGRSLEHITRIVCTHGHPDHIGGVHEISAWEYIFPSLPARNAEDWDTARAILEESLDRKSVV